MIIQVLEIGPESAFYEDKDRIEGGIFEATENSIIRPNYLGEIIPIKCPEQADGWQFHIKSVSFFDVKYKILFK